MFETTTITVETDEFNPIEIKKYACPTCDSKNQLSEHELDHGFVCENCTAYADIMSDLMGYVVDGVLV